MNTAIGWINSIGLAAVTAYCVRDYLRRRQMKLRALTIDDVNEMFEKGGLGPIPTRPAEGATQTPRVR